MAPMAGLKRTRPPQDSEDLEVESATSHLRQRHEGRKRARLTPIDGATDDESLASADPMDRDEDDISDMSDAEAMRRVERSGRDGEFVENHAADNGIIEEVQCRNFMCHANLTVKLGPLINFIIGHNGSGKSAVLTALQLCLGGKATSTNRGQSLKHFIKAGTDQATLSVKIKNQGDNAYQPDIYGKSIVVERIFSRAGTSGFKLKNEHGKIISSKKSDLEDILDALALQMDNPMNVLTQDMARQFLNSSNAIEKYKFFYKGTHLEQLDSDYRILQESLELNQQQYYNLEASAKDAGARYKETERKAALAERAAGLQDQYLHYSKQMAWVQVEDEEKKLAGMEDDIRKQEEVIQERVSAAEEFDVHMQSIDRQRDDAKSALDAIIAEKGSKAEEHEKAKENFEQVRTQLMELQTTQRGIKEEMVTAQKNIDRWNGEIEKERERISSADNGRHAQKMEEIQTAEDSLTSTREEAQQKSSGSHVFDRAVTEAQSEVEEAKSALDNNATSIRSAENRIRTFQREKGDWKAAYSPRLGTLLKAIEQESRFREKPVGPLGRHVALLKPSWSDILEKQAGSALNAFAVTSKGDQTLLSQLMRRTNYDGQIYVTSSRPINTTQHEPPQQYDTWMRVLKFDNDLVRNCMIINQGVDKTVLEPDSEKGARMLNQNIPNMSQIFSPNPVPDGAGNKWGYRFGLSNGGGESQTPIHPWNGGSRMQTDTGTQINSEKEKLARVKEQHRTFEEAHRQAQGKYQKAKQAVIRHQRDIRNLELDIDRQEVAVQDLKDALEKDTPQTGLLEQFEQNLKDAQDTKQMNENQYGDSVNEKDKLGRDARPLKARLNTIGEELADIDHRIKKAEARLEKAINKHEEEIRKANLRHEQVEMGEHIKARLEKQRDDQISTVNSFTEQAEQVSRRIPIDAGETGDSIEAKLAKLVRDQQRQVAELGGSREELTLKKLEAKQYLDERKRALNDHDQIVTTLKRALDDRLERWKKFRDLIVSRAQHNFKFLLSERQFRGKLALSHADKTLEIKVQPDTTLKSDKGRQTKTLSGGEKSFSTICLLLALWEAMGSPVRCLDEFDVFMDQINRDVSMNMMVGAARRAVSRQFILITPQSMNNANIGDDVTIHKMSDPERGQTTLTQFVGA